MNRNDSEVHSVPVLYTRGTHYQVGYNVGRAFGTLIKDFLNDLESYNKISLPLYELPKGKASYEKVLGICKAQFPQYVKEIEGTADGAQLPFHQLFILHVEYLMTANESSLTSPYGDYGCTNITCNNTNEVIMGHTEDAYPECFGRAYIVQAEIVDEDGNLLEQFSSIAYPGFLPGYTMGFNQHGMIHSINTVNPEKRNANGTPREFICRALLPTKTIEEAIDVLKNHGYGIADGCNVDIHFANQKGSKIVYSIEVGPAQAGDKESMLSILEVPVGESYSHCNRYVRLPVENLKCFFLTSTDYRQETLKQLPKPKNEEDIKSLLSDTTNPEWPIFRNGIGEDKGKTVMTGVFDTRKKTWAIYTGPSATTSPVGILYMNY